MSLTVSANDPSGISTDGDATREVFDVFWSSSQLEDRIDNAIASYYADAHDHKFLNDVLQTGMISFYSKVRLLKTIAEYLSLDFKGNDLQACRDIRNKFAHGYYSDLNETNMVIGEALSPYFLNNGKYHEIDDEYASFVRHCDRAFEEVQKLALAIINNDNS